MQMYFCKIKYDYYIPSQVPSWAKNYFIAFKISHDIPKLVFIKKNKFSENLLANFNSFNFIMKFYI